jgi:phage terminase large subunit-like protein
MRRCKYCESCRNRFEDDHPNSEETNLEELSPKEPISIPWKDIARPEQLEPSDRPWQTWLILAGRGFGKTRTGAQTVWDWIQNNRYKRIAFVGQTVIEARQVMVEGESGLLNIIPKGALKKYRKSEGVLEFSNGAIVQLFGADRYERLRGPQFDAAWVNELAKFKHTEQFWEQLSLCLRLGQDPKCIVTTTPRRNPVLTKLINDPDCVITRGSTFDNAANLAPGFLKSLEKQFAGTRLEAQEIYAQMIDETSGALWTPDKIVYETPPDEDWRRIVIAVDPAMTDEETSDETGIVVIGYNGNQQAYVLEDATVKAKPTEWVKQVVGLYHQYRQIG